jgi:hypothetical protein
MIFENDELKMFSLASAVAMERMGEPIPVDLAIALGNWGLSIDAFDALVDMTAQVQAIIDVYYDTGTFRTPGEDAVEIDYDEVISELSEEDYLEQREFERDFGIYDKFDEAAF